MTCRTQAIQGDDTGMAGTKAHMQQKYEGLKMELEVRLGETVWHLYKSITVFKIMRIKVLFHFIEDNSLNISDSFCRNMRSVCF
jgi:hypothetical protein